MAAGGRKKGSIFIIIAIILLVVLALAGAGLYLTNRLITTAADTISTLPTLAPAVDMVRIMVVVQPVSRGTTITADMVKTVAYPRSEMVEGLFYTDADLDKITGKRAKFDLAQGTPLTPALLTDAPAGSYAALLIPRGYVAVSIPIDRLSAVSYALQPGDHVNVMAAILLVDLDTEFQTILPDFTASVVAPGPGAEGSGDTLVGTILTGGAGSTLGRVTVDPALNLPIYLMASELQRPRLVTQTIVQDAIVLWVGDFPSGEISTGPIPTPTPAPEGGEVATYSPPNVLTLVVSPQDALALNYLMLSGAQINLALRGTGDSDRVQTEAVTLQFIMDQYGLTNPTKLSIGIQPRIDDLALPPVGPGQ